MAKQLFMEKTFATPAKNIIINGRFLLQPITGVQRYALEWCKALDVLLEHYPNWQVQILMPRRLAFHHQLPKYKNINIRQVGILQGPPWEQLEMPFYLGDETIICLCNTAPIISLWLNKNINVTVHDLSYRYFPKSYSLIFKALYHTVIPIIMRYAYRVITVSKTEQLSILKHYPIVGNRLTAIQNGGITSDQKEEHNKSQPPVKRLNKTLLYVGSLSPRKNFPALLQVMIKLAKTNDIHFVVIGGTSGGIVNKTDNRKDINNSNNCNITFLGQVHDWRTICHHYQHATAFIFPSLYEASPLPPIEAMALGCPVISSSIPALKERLGDAACYFDEKKTGAMQNTIEQVLNDHDLQENLRQKGLRHAAKFTWQHSVKQSLAHIFDHTLENSD